MEERKNIPASRPSKHPGERSTQRGSWKEAGIREVRGEGLGDMQESSELIESRETQVPAKPLSPLLPLCMLGWGREPLWELEKVTSFPGKDSFGSKCTVHSAECGLAWNSHVCPQAGVQRNLGTEEGAGVCGCRPRPCRQEFELLSAEPGLLNRAPDGLVGSPQLGWEIGFSVLAHL